MGRVRSFLYRLARALGDAEAIASGKPERIVKRVARRSAYRAAGRAIRRLFR